MQFLDDWLATDRDPINASLACFVGCDAYGVETLRDDLARFMVLFGGSDGEGIFSLSSRSRSCGGCRLWSGLPRRRPRKKLSRLWQALTGCLRPTRPGI